MSSKILFQNVRVVDGTGADSYIADVSVHDENIASITRYRKEKDKLNHDQVIDCSGLVLSPGFIDVHTHDDNNLIKHPDCLAKISQGVTTVIVGNCGISASPAVLADEPPDPMNLLGNKTDFRFPTFLDYVKAVNEVKPAVNVAALVGHTTLRNNVMENLHRPATNGEIQAMKSMLRESLAQGAIGLSSGLAYHNAKAATTEEVMLLAEELAEFKGIYTTHMRSEFEEILDAMQESFDIGKHGKVPVVISHLKCAGAKNWGRTTETLDLMEKTSKDLDIGCDCYPYTASASTLDLKQVTDDFDIFITWSESLPQYAGRMLKDIANDMGLSLLDTAKALQPGGAVYHCMDDSDVERVLKYRLTMIGSDGLPNDPHPHPRLWGTFPRVIGHYCRDKKLFSLEQAVQKMTSLPASRFRLFKRGVIEPGAYADLVLFDPNSISDAATYENPIRMAQGIQMVLVNGNITYHNGKVHSERFGQFLLNKAN